MAVRPPADLAATAPPYLLGPDARCSPEPHEHEPQILVGQDIRGASRLVPNCRRHLFWVSISWVPGGAVWRRDRPSDQPPARPF